MQFGMLGINSARNPAVLDRQSGALRGGAIRRASPWSVSMRLDACDGVCVQHSYADYVNYPKSVNAKEAVGSVLWATTAVEKPGRS